jgi:hypothetical protein
MLWRLLKENDMTGNKILEALAALPPEASTASVFVPNTSALRAQANAAIKPVLEAELAKAIAAKKPSANAPDVEFERS